MSCCGVVSMAARMTGRAMFWNLPSLLSLALAAIAHVVDAYFMVGLNNTVQTLVRSDEPALPVSAGGFFPS